MRSPGAGSKFSSRVSNFTGHLRRGETIQERIARQISSARVSRSRSKRKGGLSLAGWFASGAGAQSPGANCTPTRVRMAIGIRPPEEKIMV